jgi:hypothetical protein
MTETELMPKLVVGYTELDRSKLKKGKGFLKPNFELGPSRVGRGAGCYWASRARA